MKKKYTVTLNGTKFTRSSDRDYESAGAYQHKESGAWTSISFAGPGLTPKPASSWYKNNPDWVLVIAKVEVK